MLHKDEVIGAIGAARREAKAFDDKQVALMKAFADQAVIAIENARLFHEVQMRTKELQESLDRQTATSEVLGVISRSPNALQPVLDTIVATAQRLCQAERAAIWRLEGETFRAVAHHGLPEELLKSLYSMRRPLSRGNMVGRATLARRAVQVEDAATDPELVAAAHAYSRAGNIHTVLAVPLLLKGEPIGVITLARTQVAPFDDKQVALIEAFADQAVIAIENSRLFEAEQASKHELQVSLEYQTASSEVLGVISRSPSDLKPVLLAIAETAGRLCGTDDVGILLRENDQLRFTVNRGSMAALSHVLPLGRASVSGRTVMDGVPIHVHDLQAEETEYPRGYDIAQRYGHRTALGIPLMRDGSAIGCILLRHTVIRPFTDRQIDLLETFADQAVIAIENTRLFEAEQASKRELQEALEQQTATADVLKVISRSALDVQKVLDA